ncbi:MAG: type IV pilus modification PilV family protein [Lachnospiraceae bacterium]
MDKRKEKIEWLKKNQQGETLLELVFSIGLFAIIMLMVATMFATANRVSIKNYSTETKIDDALRKVIREEGIESVSESTIVYTVDGVSRSVPIEKVTVEGFEKYRLK